MTTNIDDRSRSLVRISSVVVVVWVVRRVVVVVVGRVVVVVFTSVIVLSVSGRLHALQTRK